MPTLQEVSDDTPPSEQPAAVKAIKDSDEFDEDELEVRASQKFGARHFAPRRFAPVHKRCFTPDSMRHFATCST